MDKRPARLDESLAEDHHTYNIGRSLTRTAGPPRALFAPLVAALAAGLAYLNALDNPFVYDDYRTVLDNGSIRSLWHPRAIVMHDVTRPLVNLSYAVDHSLWGQGPFGFHLTNVLLHVLNVVLLFALAARLADDRRRAGEQTRSTSPMLVAFVAAAIFAVHPVMTEAVGYASARADVLSATLCLSAFLLGRRWLAARGETRSTRNAEWFLTVGFFATSLLAKESAVMMPALLFCYDRLLLRNRDRRASWLLHGPLFGIALLAGAARVFVFAAVERSGVAPIAWHALLDQAQVIWRYAGLLFVPVGQSIFHQVRPAADWSDPMVLVDGFAVIGLIAAVGLAWRAKHIDSVVRFGVLWFVLLLLPSAALGLMDDTQPMAEHRVYLASCGLFLAAGAGAGWLDDRLSAIGPFARSAGALVLGVALLSLGARTLLRNVVWADPVTLWREAAERTQTSPVPHMVLGESLHAAGRHQEAVPEFRTALALNPDDEMGYLKLAICLTELQRPAEAGDALDRLEQRSPRSIVVSTGRGAIALMLGDAERARRYFLETLDGDPQNVLALQWLAVLAEQTANPEEARRRCEELDHLIPGRASTADCISRNRMVR